MARNEEKRTASTTGDDPATESTHQTFKFDYIKSNHFRVIYVDGVWGGLRPDSIFHLSFYNERSAIPRRVSVDLDPDRLTAAQSLKSNETTVTVESRESIVREVEVCALMDLTAAEALRDWLSEKIRVARQRVAQLPDEDDEGGDP